MVNTAPTGPEFLAAQLERLVEMPLETPADMDRWYSAAHDVQSALHDLPPFEFPHHVWHYFADADIRRREPLYRERQEKAIRDYIAEVRANHLTRRCS
jgi:hypothetical protein